MSPPVHQHRTWRHLQRAMVSAHPELGNVSQANFQALMATPASIAVWILQHEPHLARKQNLEIMIVQAIEFQALDSGRWLQFIPWLLGSPGLKVTVALVGHGLLDSIRADNGGTDPRERDFEKSLRSQSWFSLRTLSTATLFEGTPAEWRRVVDSERDAPSPPDLCVVFTPSFAQHYDTLLSEEGLAPFMRSGTPVAVFSPSEAEQLFDLYTLRAANLELSDEEAWPNPWSLPVPDAQRRSVYGKMGWAATVARFPIESMPDRQKMLDLAHALEYLGPVAEAGGVEALLTLGESLLTAPRDGVDHQHGAPLLRLPFDVAVDSSNGHVYQLQDVTALLLDEVPPVPTATLESFPGDDDLLLRAIWTVAVHRDHVAPYVQRLDDALRSEFGLPTSESE